jgi:DNA-binding transcriptional ArsR family regulator
MVYRVHFTAEDLAHTRVADAPMPLVELAFAIRAVQDRSQPARLDSWRRSVRSRLHDSARMVLSVTPPIGYTPTFYLRSRKGDPEDLLKEVYATPGATIRQELSWIAERQSIPSWSYRLADDAQLFEQFCDGVSSLYADMLAPYWSRLSSVFAADRTIRMRDLMRGGVQCLLSQANPRWMRWRPPVLEIRMRNGVEHDLVLQGQGIVLVPSVFGDRSFVIDDAQPQPIVSYPAHSPDPMHQLAVFTPTSAASTSVSAVAALLGHTRSAVLTIIAERPGCSTTELAVLAGIAPASASEHATVLRKAGLVQTLRHHKSALHSPTDLGITLLNATGQSSP